VRRANGARSPMPASRTERLLPEAYLEEYEGKPANSIVIGLRTPNDTDYAEALRQEDDADAMLTLVAIGICDPNDCRRPHPSFPYADQQLKLQLKPRTIRYLFDRIEQLHLETSPTIPLATDEELFLLGDALQSGERLETLEKASAAAANRVRRLATVLAEMLGVLDSSEETTVVTAEPAA